MKSDFLTNMVVRELLRGVFESPKLKDENKIPALTHPQTLKRQATSCCARMAQELPSTAIAPATWPKYQLMLLSPARINSWPSSSGQASAQYR